MADTDVARYRSALNAIDPAGPRDEWVRALMAAKAAGLDFNDVDEWSARAGRPKYPGSRTLLREWRGLKDGEIAAGTLIHLAKQAGWSDPVQQHPEPIQIPANPQQQQATGGNFKPPRWWDDCAPASPDHAYIARKQGLPDGLRVFPETTARKIKGHDLAGWLAVPAWSPNGELRAIQCIHPSGQPKLNSPGSSLQDGMFLVGDPAQSPRILLVEGVATAWACWKATGHACAVTFGVGRTKAVCEALRSKWPACKVALVLDRGQEAKAAELAKDLRAQWIEMPAGTASNYDAWDYAAEHGAEALEELLSKPKALPQRFILLTPAELLQAPRLRWLVRGVLPATGLAAIYGASGSGKTFLALDLCGAVAEGRDWFACRVTEACRVTYLALEGEDGLRQRIEAWQAANGRDFPAGVRIVTTPLDLRKPMDRVELVDAIQAAGHTGGMLVVDTLNRAAPGADENSSEDMGNIIAGAKALHVELGGLVLLVHHSGKDESQGMRGHSSLIAALDAAVEVKGQIGTRTWALFKSKDGASGQDSAFRLEPVTIDHHEDGEPITSCTVVPADAPAVRTIKPTPPNKGNPAVAWEVLGELLRQPAAMHAAGAPPTLPPGRPAVSLDEAKGAIAERMTAEPKHRRTRAAEALNALQGRGLVHVESDWIWLP